jgi:cyclophilin family peptidyl-prolyl cis-trans isomerase
VSWGRGKPGTADFFSSVGVNLSLDSGNRFGLPSIDGKGYAVFGQVVQGMAVVKNIFNY